MGGNHDRNCPFRDAIDALRQDLAVDIENLPRYAKLTVYASDGSVAATVRVTDSVQEAERSRADYTVVVGASDSQARALTGQAQAYGAASWTNAVHVASTIIARIREQKRGRKS